MKHLLILPKTKVLSIYEIRDRVKKNTTNIYMTKKQYEAINEECAKSSVEGINQLWLKITDMEFYNAKITITGGNNV